MLVMDRTGPGIKTMIRDCSAHVGVTGLSYLGMEMYVDKIVRSSGVGADV
jgi:hypothetical protein